MWQMFWFRTNFILRHTSPLLLVPPPYFIYSAATRRKCSLISIFFWFAPRYKLVRQTTLCLSMIIMPHWTPNLTRFQSTVGTVCTRFLQRGGILPSRDQTCSTKSLRIIYVDCGTVPFFLLHRMAMAERTRRRSSHHSTIYLSAHPKCRPRSPLYAPITVREHSALMGTTPSTSSGSRIWGVS
jgi:hypothetical protein